MASSYTHRSQAELQLMINDHNRYVGKQYNGWDEVLQIWPSREAHMEWRTIGEYLAACGMNYDEQTGRFSLPTRGEA